MSSVDVETAARDYALQRLLDARLQRTIKVPAPGAGADWSTIVPAGAYWWPITIHFRFAADATVATRIPSILYRDTDGTLLAQSASSVGPTAGQTFVVTHGGGYGDHLNVNSLNVSQALTQRWLQPSDTIASVTTGLQAGDLYTLVVVTVIELTADRVREQADYISRL